MNEATVDSHVIGIHLNRILAAIAEFAMAQRRLVGPDADRIVVGKSQIQQVVLVNAGLGDVPTLGLEGRDAGRPLWTDRTDQPEARHSSGRDQAASTEAGTHGRAADEKLSPRDGCATHRIAFRNRSRASCRLHSTSTLTPAPRQWAGR